MKRKKRSSIFLLLSLMMSLLLTACGSEEKAAADSTGNSDLSQTAAKGRYVEEELEFPQRFEKLFEVKKSEDGRVQLLFESEPGSLYLYESNDKGKSWESKLEVTAGELPKGYRAASACVKEDGTVVISAGEMSSDVIMEKHPVGYYEYYILKAGEEARALELELPEPTEANLEIGFGLRDLAVSEDNLLYGTLEMREVESSEYSIYCFDLNRGSKKWSREVSIPDYTLKGEILYTLEEGRGEGDGGRTILTWNSQTGEDAGEVAMPSEVYSNGVVNFEPESQKVYFCTHSGIFAADSNLAVQEKLVDGRTSSFSVTGYNAAALCTLEEEVFLVFSRANSGGTMKVLRYEYDGELSSRPENQLTVYSLHYNQIVSKMVSDFQRKNPDILVNYWVGTEEQNAPTTADAIRILNTEMLAGNIPDVMVLSGLPWQSYGTKGILKNVSNLEALQSGEELFTNLFAPFRDGDSQYAVPVSFKIPIVLGREGTVEEIQSLEGLAEAAEQTGDVLPFYQKDDRLMQYLISVCWNEVQEGDKVSREKLSDMLKNIKRLNDSLTNYENDMIFADGDMLVYFERESGIDTFSVDQGQVAMGLHYLSYINDCVDMYNYNQTAGQISKDVFRPLLLGISGTTNEGGPAEQFINFVLSEKEQEIFSGTAYPILKNFPVNKAAFEKMIQKPTEGEIKELRKVYDVLGMDFTWPEEAYFKALEDKIMSLSMPTMEDEMILNTVMGNAKAYFSGERELNMVVDEIAQKLELYLAE